MRRLRLDMGFGKRCELYTSMDYGHVSHNRTSPEIQRKKLEKDKEDFLWSYRPFWSWGSYGRDHEKQEVLEFIKEHHLDFFVIFQSDREDPVKVRKEAVRRDRLIVVIEERNYGGSGLIPPPQHAARALGSRQQAQRAVKAFNYIPPAFDPDPLPYLDTRSTVGDASEALLVDAQPFGYTPDAESGDAEELAGTTNEKYARKMFGYDNSTFREMIHRFKKTNGIGPNDDLEFEGTGDVYFQGNYIDNFHDYNN